MAEPTSRRRFAVLAICCMSLLIVGLDGTIVNVALPALRRDLGASPAGLQWTIDSYTLVLASLLMLGGSTGDRLGRRRIFQTGLALFTAGSLLCSLAPGLGWLVAFRMVQAVGGSMLNPVAMSIITNTFTDPRERARAIGLWGAVIGISMALGPVLGGILVETVSWRAIFWINIPIGLAALVLTHRFVPESRAPSPRRLDPVGQLLVIAVLSTLTYSIIEAPAAGWTSTETLVLFAVAVAAAALLVGYESRRTEPLLDVRFFRSAPFSGATAIAVCAFGALAGFLFLNTIYLQDVRGYSALHAGLLTLPMALATLVVAPLSGRAVGRFGPRPSLLAAGVTLTAGSAAMTGLSPQTSVTTLMVAYVLFGTGFGLVNAPITNTAVSGMPLAQAGVAAAVASTSRQVGQSLGVAVIGSVAAATATVGAVGAVGDGPGVGIDPTSTAAWWAVVAACAAVLALGFATTGTWARRTADQTRSRLLTTPAPGQAATPQEGTQQVATPPAATPQAGNQQAAHPVTAEPEPSP
ncbi:MFS transporter, DHA2 family, methylenomycin A resistance protein [Frankia sp. Hr75.2]|nr:MFS transporter, DHA2 family, methylenomycin A resistance protein [Frankia sp. Hr75.2]